VPFSSRITKSVFNGSPVITITKGSRGRRRRRRKRGTCQSNVSECVAIFHKTREGLCDIKRLFLNYISRVSYIASK
jgi:hypothetical protein